MVFLSRAALKMANMDAVFDRMFTNPRIAGADGRQKDLVPESSDNILYFADVCAGPGGFTEYVLFKKKWHCHGFGFTLQGKDDFKLGSMQAGPPEAFEPFYGKENTLSVVLLMRCERNFVRPERQQQRI